MTTFIIVSALIFAAVMFGYVKMEEKAEKKAEAKRAAAKSAKFRAMLKEAREEKRKQKLEEYYKNNPREKMVAELLNMFVEPVVKVTLGK